jgi:hypothetical protein
MTKFIRATNGIIFDYSERLAKVAGMEVVTEQEAYPERFAPVDLSKREQKIDLDVPEAVTEPPPYVSPEFAADAGRPLGSARAQKRAAAAKDAPVSKFDVSGLEGEI